jgi:hypothetical protein
MEDQTCILCIDFPRQPRLPLDTCAVKHNMCVWFLNLYSMCVWVLYSLAIYMFYVCYIQYVCMGFVYVLLTVFNCYTPQKYVKKPFVKQMRPSTLLTT